MAQIAALDPRLARRDVALREALGFFNLAGAIRRARAVLAARSLWTTDAPRRAEFLAALGSGDAGRLRAASAACASVPRFAADLAHVACIVAASPGGPSSEDGP